jgi:maltose O-acetyltransferase
MPKTEKERMLAGELYHAGDRQLQADQAAAKAWMARYNASWARLPTRDGFCCGN